MKTEYREKYRKTSKKATSKQESKRSCQRYYARYPGGGRRLSEQERRADALALRAEERRDKLRKAAGSGKYAMIRRYLNGETHVRKPYVSMPEQNRAWRGTR